MSLSGLEVSINEDFNMTSAHASEIVESSRGALGKEDFDSAWRLMQDNMTFH